MVLFARTALCLAAAAVAAGAAACAPADPGPYAVPDAPIETDNGQFTVSLRAAEGREWPEFVGSTVIAARVEVGPDAAPDDPQFRGDEPEPPFALELAAEDSRAARALTAKTWPLTADGSRWLIALEFPAAGDFELPLTIRDALGRSDSALLVFHVEVERR